MTTAQLGHKFITDFGTNRWPKSFEVDADTFANICNDYFLSQKVMGEHWETIHVTIGPNGGFMFKGVELLLKD